jgi:hypothetical protein
MQAAALPVALAAALASGMLAGCGTPGMPQPPSLNLPQKASDLAASRAGNQVTLTWTMPKKNTDKLLLKGVVPARVCRREGANAACDAAGAEISFAPGADGSFTETLPAALVAGPPRPLNYFVEFCNRNGRSAGLSNAAVVLAGEAPAPVANFTAELRKQGVVLRWARNADATSAGIRLHRKLLTPPASKPQQGPLAPEPEPIDQNLIVDSCAPSGHNSECGTLDKSIRFGETYEYRAQRVARVTQDGATLELAGELSAPVRIEARDIFPPEVPTGLAAVGTAGEEDAAIAIDLSWQPVSDANLAGYIVYRIEKTGEGAWQRISPAEPLVPPAFHDTSVLSGHAYRYAVSAIGQNGHESARSAETEETAPTQ